jgi:hypothetical protein
MFFQILSGAVPHRPITKSRRWSQALKVCHPITPTTLWWCWQIIWNNSTARDSTCNGTEFNKYRQSNCQFSLIFFKNNRASSFLLVHSISKLKFRVQFPSCADEYQHRGFLKFWIVTDFAIGAGISSKFDFL